MKTYNVFYDLPVAYGVLEEKVLTVNNANNKSEAIIIYRNSAPKNAIFRSVKKPIDII